MDCHLSQHRPMTMTETGRNIKTGLQTNLSGLSNSGASTYKDAFFQMKFSSDELVPPAVASLQTR
jgi:hypothetical protein